MNNNIIPIMTCFDNNYAAPASVCFYSLLKNSSKNYYYKLYVLHTDIASENQSKLQETIKNFSNADLEFINMDNKFDDLFQKTKTKGHYSKEMFYKFLAPSIFPQYEKIIITDVDVVFLNDVSEIYEGFSIQENLYLYGHRMPQRMGDWSENFYNTFYQKDFSKDEIEKINTSAGFWVFNLNKLREDKLEEKFIACAIENAHRIKQPEQDVINITCHPYVKYMPAKAVFCTYLFDMYKEENDFDKSFIYTKEELKEAFAHPIQLHYATSEKPWNNPRCLKAEIWWEYLKETPFYFDVIKKMSLVEQKKTIKTKKLLSMSLGKQRLKITLERK